MANSRNLLVSDFGKRERKEEQDEIWPEQPEVHNPNTL